MTISDTIELSYLTRHSQRLFFDKIRKRQESPIAESPKKCPKYDSSLPKKVSFNTEVFHRQTFGSLDKHGLYSTYHKETTIKLVDESETELASEVSYQEVESTLQNIVIKKVKDKNTDRKDPLVYRKNRGLTERVVTQRTESQIKKASPSWYDQELRLLYDQAIKTLHQEFSPLTRCTIEKKMTAIAKSSTVKSELYSLQELTQFFKSAMGQTCPSPDLTTKPQEPLVTTDKLVARLTFLFDDIMGIEKASNKQFKVTSTRISPREIRHYLEHHTLDPLPDTTSVFLVSI